MKNRMKRSNKNRIWIAMVLTAVVAVSVWMAETGIVKAATVNGKFIVGGETVEISIAGDANSVTGKTSYTKGPGEVEVMVRGDAVAPAGSSQITGLLATPPAVNTPGGAAGTITAPAGKVIVSAHSHHYATINGASDYRDLTLF